MFRIFRRLLELNRQFRIRSLHYFARHFFPSGLRVNLHRFRGVRIGKNVFMGIDVNIEDRNPENIIIEEGAFIADNVIITSHKRDLTHYKRGVWIGDCEFQTSKVRIKKGAHIGLGVIILPGVTVGKGAVVGAGSVVTKSIPDYVVVAGNPARVIRHLQ